MIVKLSTETKHGQQTERTRNYNIVTYLSEADILDVATDNVTTNTTYKYAMT